ncbi:hypothetical protein sos41_05650 [Alphaproteobacteria bacterium SO-S41]|nr:hypothetical protein sos41_05650 [Alphaproteobacteria bacterium SO-S41]
MSTLDRRTFLTGLAGAGALTLAGCATTAKPVAGFPTAAGPIRLPVSPVLDPEKRLGRIGIGSCFSQEKPGGLLGTAIRARPDLFLMMGDNVYGDTKDPNVEELVAAYAGALARSDYRAFREAMPMAATWDDHDYGLNDAGAEYDYKAKTTPLFFDFWGVPADSPRRRTSGIYDAFITGPKGARVQTILLDTRTFRDRFKDTDEKGAAWKERYVADPDPQKTILGADQWAWLEAQLAAPADLRLIVSSYQLVVEGHGWEKWGNFPLERERLYALIAKTKANGVVIVSGDRHRAGIYREAKGVPYPIYEVTSSAINMSSSWPDPGEEAGPNRIGPSFRGDNVGLVTLDWEKRGIGFYILDKDDKTALSHAFSMDELKT